MVKSGLIFGVAAFVLVRGVTLITPFCGVCLGLFNILWIALFGLVSGALWYLVKGKNQLVPNLPPHPPSLPVISECHLIELSTRPKLAVACISQPR